MGKAGKKLHGITKAKEDGPFPHTGYQAQIKIHGKVITWPLRFEKPEDAARVWDVMAIYLKGPDAVLNFDGRPPPSMTRAEIKLYLIRRGVLARRYLTTEPKRFAKLGIDPF